MQGNKPWGWLIKEIILLLVYIYFCEHKNPIFQNEVFKSVHLWFLILKKFSDQIVTCVDGIVDNGQHIKVSIKNIGLQSRLELEGIGGKAVCIALCNQRRTYE